MQCDSPRTKTVCVISTSRFYLRLLERDSNRDNALTPALRSTARRSFSLTVFGAGCIIKSTSGSDPSGRAAKGGRSVKKCISTLVLYGLLFALCTFRAVYSGIHKDFNESTFIFVVNILSAVFWLAAFIIRLVSFCSKPKAEAPKSEE